MAESQRTRHPRPRLTIPRIRVDQPCGDLGPHYSCTRPAGHTGRHLYAWRNAGPLTGRVREVWS